MTNIKRVALWIIVALLLIACFAWWQMSQLGRGLRTIHAATSEEVLSNAISAEVLASKLRGGDGQSSAASKSLLDQYMEDPRSIHQRYLMITTWLHASQIITSIHDWSTFEGKMIDSEMLTNLSSDTRVDGWGVPFCIWVGQKQLVFISSGGTRVPPCGVLEQTARKAATSSKDSKLTTIENLLITVQNRPTNALEPPITR